MMAARNTASTRQDPRQLKGHHVLIWLAGFFGLMFLANGIFVYFAVTTFPGEDVRKSYLTGLDYNTTLDKRAAQAALGWQASAGLLSEGVAGTVPARLEVNLLREDESGLETLEVSAELRRTTTSAEDVTAQLQPVGEGRYLSAPLNLCEGLWEVRITARDADGKAFEARKQLIHGRKGVRPDDPDPEPRCPAGALPTRQE